MRSLLVLLAALVPLTTAPMGASRLVSRDLHADVHQAIDHVTLSDPGLRKFFGTSAGYAVFPGITKGA